MKTVMFVGYGSMAKKVHEMLPSGIQLTAIVSTPRSAERIKAEVGESVDVITNIDELTAMPDLAIEMAGQDGLKAHGIDIVTRSIPLGVISVGAFTDHDFVVSLTDAAKQAGVSVHILAGAVAGIDGIHAASLAGLDQVVYQGRKSPASWRGSYADALLDYDNLTEATTFFAGSAREAANLFPANSNVAATIALAGVGLDDTQVELIADPNLERNMHYIMAQGTFGQMEVSMKGLPLEENPKTSSLAAFSALKLCCQLDQTLQL